MDKDYLKAKELVKKAKKTIQEENRFFPDSIFVKELNSICTENEILVPEGRIFYRARMFDRNYKRSTVDKCFEGYSKEESFVNMNDRWNAYGRMNAQGIKVLYVATDERTTIMELHPGSQDLLSVALIRLNENLKIVNLSSGVARGSEEFHLFVSTEVQEIISQGHTERDYVFSQYISSYCKYMGYDGIAYKSKYARKADVKEGNGVNIAIFNYEKCEPIGSYLKEVESISVKTKDCV